MAERVILYEETYDSDTNITSRTQFNPVTDIKSVFHGRDQISDGSQPVGNSIFTNNQESLLTILSRINSWFNKLKGLNDYTVASSTTAGNKDLALQKTVNTQINNLNNQIIENKNAINELEKVAATAYLDDVIVDMAYNLDGIGVGPTSSSSGIYYTWNRPSNFDGFYAADTILLLMGIKVGDDKFKYHFFKINIYQLGFDSLSGPDITLLTKKGSSNIRIFSDDGEYLVPDNCFDNIFIYENRDEKTRFVFYFEPVLDSGKIVKIHLRFLNQSWDDRTRKLYAKIIQGAPTQSIYSK